MIEGACSFREGEEMQRCLRKPLFMVVAILGVGILAYPFLASEAQKRQSQLQVPTTTPEQEYALQIVKQNAVASKFYDLLQGEEQGWTLVNANRGLTEGKGNQWINQTFSSTFLGFKSQDKVANVYIDDLLSPEAARSAFHRPLSQAMIVSCKGDECGDEGQKIYGTGLGGRRFSFLRFRQGHIFVTVYRTSEDDAKFFARLAIDAIDAVSKK